MRSFLCVLTIALFAGCAAGRVGKLPADDADTDGVADTDLGDGVVVTCTGLTGDTDGPTHTDDTGSPPDTGATTDAADTDAADTDPGAADTDPGAADTDPVDTDPPAFCGDGRVTGTEACDDRYDTIPYDGCTGCQVDNGWWCYGEPSYCVVL